MKTKSYVNGWVVGCVLALVVLLAGASSVQATTLFSYNFEGLTNGSIDSPQQDGWLRTGTWASGLNVTDGPATANVASSKVVDVDYGGGSHNVAGSYRPIPTHYFTSADTDVRTEFLCLLR